MRRRSITAIAVFPLALAVLVAVPVPASAHCDSLDGPVVSAARVALGRGDLQPVLKWVKPEAEVELRAAFEKALAVRAAGGQARDLADTYFFETLVRLHRAGEGAPYTGLKPAGSIAKPIAAADASLDKGSVDELGRLLAEHLGAGVRERFASALQARTEADRTTEAGRRYVAAYVDYVHYIEAIAQAVHGEAGHAHAAPDVHSHGRK